MPALHKGFKNKLLRAVEQTITAYGMFKPHDAVLVGVSGGPDSTALLHVLVTLASRLSLKLGVAHLNHGLRRQDADDDAKFVESLAAEYDLPFYLHKADVRKYQLENKLSLEEAARRVRYAFFLDAANRNRFDKIALGHHYDDNAELVLMNLFRGSGPLGIAGIPPVRNGKIVRPLIKLKRTDIVGYLKQNKLKYVSDRSNLDQRHLRNKVRHHLIPLLESAYNPKIRATLNRLASIVSAEEEWMDAAVKPLLHAAVSSTTGNTLSLAVSRLEGLPTAVLRRIIRKAIVKIKGDLRRITFAHIDAVVRLLENRRPHGNLDLPDKIRVQRRNDLLLIFKETKALRDLNLKSISDETPAYEYMLDGLGTVFIKEIDAQLKLSQITSGDRPDFSLTGHQTGFFDMDRLSFPLIIRNFRPGDRFRPLGMAGTQKLKDFFINQKVPRSQRAQCPVMLCRGKIIWVVGHRIDESVKVIPSTGTILKGELILA